MVGAVNQKRCKKYISTLEKYKYAISPRGNGLDCHRLWECLYLGIIPVTEKQKGLNQFSNLPILFVDKWENITPEYLEKSYNKIVHKFDTEEMKILKVSYWKKQILEKALK